MEKLLKIFLLFLPLTFLLTSTLADRPNVVFILVDDMGYGDLGCYGHPRAKTPVIDGLAKEGVRFTQHYSNGTECSPTRTALLTGRYPQRAGGLECAIGTGNVGRYDDAIRVNQRAVELDGAYMAQYQRPTFYLNYYAHNIEFCTFGAMMDTSVFLVFNLT